MRVFRPLTIFYFFLPLFLLTGCYKSSRPVETRNEAHAKFEQLCREEYQINVKVTPFKNSVWIYVATEEPIVDPRNMDFKGSARQVLFERAYFKDRAFHIEYHIAPTIKFESPGYGNLPSESYQKLQQNILAAVLRAYGDVSPDQAPQLFTVIIADTKKGLERKTIFTLADLKRGAMDASFGGEYAMRLISKDPQGNPDIINDAPGRHLVTYNLTLPDLLAEQILHRLRMHYRQEAADFSPTGSDVDILLRFVQETVTAYDFKDFDGVKLTDLGTGKEYDFKREQLATFSQ